MTSRTTVQEFVFFNDIFRRMSTLSLSLSSSNVRLLERSFPLAIKTIKKGKRILLEHAHFHSMHSCRPCIAILHFILYFSLYVHVLLYQTLILKFSFKTSLMLKMLTICGISFVASKLETKHISCIADWNDLWSIALNWFYNTIYRWASLMEFAAIT